MVDRLGWPASILVDAWLLSSHYLELSLLHAMGVQSPIGDRLGSSPNVGATVKPLGCREAAGCSVLFFEKEDPAEEPFGWRVGALAGVCVHREGQDRRADRVDEKLTEGRDEEPVSRIEGTDRSV
jgi:hypothetical protein